jgi:HAD superfamily hydrolase (TIGR01509 family)
MTLQALIFDFDGLIVDTETPGFISWQELYQEFGQALRLEDWTHATGYVGGFDPALHLEKLLGRKVDWTELAPKRDARNWELTLQAAALSGIANLMRDAKGNKLPLGVASNSGTGWVEQGLVRLGLRELIDVVITRDMVLSPKPAPDIYLKAAQTLRVDPAFTVALEDSEPGCRSAKRAGLSVVAIPNRFSERQELSAADLIVKSAEELTLERLNELVAGSEERFIAN